MGSKVCIIAFANRMITPYMDVYTRILNENNIAYDVILWNRYGIDENIEGCKKIHSFDYTLFDTKNLIKKVFPMLAYRNFVLKTLKQNNYSKLVVLSSLPGVLIEKYLLKKKQNKYIFDIRDYSYENIGWYYKKMKSVMKNSAINVISSPEFKTFLPDEETVLMHNCSFETLSDKKFVKSKKNVLSVAFVGAIRYAEECKKFLVKIKNNPRIVFRFYGRGEDEGLLKDFCIQSKIDNVEFYGEYQPNEKERIINDNDLLFNAYGNETTEVKYALSNKYYDAMYYKKPLIVNSQTAMERCSSGTSFVVDYDGDVAQGLLEWYKNINEKEFDILAEKYLESAIEDNVISKKQITRFLCEG